MGEFVVAQKSLILFNKKILLLQRASEDARGNSGNWELVGGCLEFGENLLEGLVREIKEETELTARIDRLLCASTHVPTSAEQAKQFVFLYYLSYADTDRVKLSEEHTDYLWATRNQMIEIIDKSILNDLISNKVLDTLEIE